MGMSHTFVLKEFAEHVKGFTQLIIQLLSLTDNKGLEFVL